MNKIIIGGGISGLIWKYYHPEYQIISPEQPGGTYAKTYMTWLHDCIETRKLLTDLSLPIKTKRSYIGYYYKGWIMDSLTGDMNIMMIQKKMTEWNKSLDTSFVPRTKDLSLSTVGSTTYMNTLDVDLNEVIKRLSTGANIENGFVTKIDDVNIIVKSNFSSTSIETVVPYDKLVSTMAAPFFWKAYGKEKEFRCLPITNVVTSVKPKAFDGRFEMCYYDDTQKFSRISHMGDKYAIEFTGTITKEEFQKEYPELPIEDYFVVKQGRIFENGGNSPPSEKIIFLGRFAQWKYGVTTEHVIAQVLEKIN